MGVGIVDYGIYIPRFRIKRSDIAQAWDSAGRGEISISGTDEDSITMAVEAACRAMEGNCLRSDIANVYFSSTTLPYLDYSSAGIIHEALGIGDEAEIADFTGSPRSGVAALRACADGVEAGRFPLGLVINSDFRQGQPGSSLELNFGAGAVSLILGNKDTVADLVDFSSFTGNFVDTWRNVRDQFSSDYEPRFTRNYGYEEHVVKSVRKFLERRGTSASDYRFVVLQGPDARLPKNVAKKLKIDAANLVTTTIVDSLGDLGTSSVFMGLAVALESAEAGDKILLVSYGSGTSDVLVFEAKPGIERLQKKTLFKNYLDSKEYIDYLTYLKWRGIVQQAGVESKMGVPPMSPLLWRDSEALHRLMGNKCQECGYINYPPSGRKICIRCGSTEMELVEMSKHGKVHTFAVNFYLPRPLDSPLPIVIVDLDDGSRYRALGTEMKVDSIEIDSSVELVFRVIAEERGFSLYGYKARVPRF